MRLSAAWHKQKATASAPDLMGITFPTLSDPTVVSHIDCVIIFSPTPARSIVRFDGKARRRVVSYCSAFKDANM